MHFVELVGVASPEDVVGEVGSALGVRDSVSGRRVLTAEQRNDVRARIAQAARPGADAADPRQLRARRRARSPTWSPSWSPPCRRLRVVTTTRAPLGDRRRAGLPARASSPSDAAADLFGQRASAARPGVALDDEAVRRVVRRLDGLPLAIELAAAKVRVMSVDDIDRRLDDRFALLRGGDRSAPDRHQTLVAVIDWSWNLLTEAERRALRWLSVFHDGFTLAGAGDAARCDALDLVQSLVDQSLLTVIEARESVRYRMLETVREFGRMQLVGAGEDAAAEDAQLAWARRTPRRTAPSSGRPARSPRSDALAAEENNLADALRAAVAVPDPAATADLTAALAGFWTVRGENTRVIAVTAAVDAALAGWEPAPDEIDVAVTAAAVTALNTVVGEIAEAPSCLALLADVRRPGDRATRPGAGGGPGRAARGRPGARWSGSPLIDVAHGYDRESAAMARLWSAHYLENDGDPERALEEASRGLALVEDSDGPWIRAMMHSVAGGLNAQLGKREEAAAARAGRRSRSSTSSRPTTTGSRRGPCSPAHAIAEGRFEEAERLIAEIDRLSHERSGFGGAFVTGTVRAELALAKGDVEEGLRLYRVAGRRAGRHHAARAWSLTGLEPWTLFGDAAGTTAYALHGTGDDGADLFEALRAKAPQVLEPGPSPDGLPGRRHGAARARHLGAAQAGDGPRGRRAAAGARRAVRLPAVHATMDPARGPGEAERVAPGLARPRCATEYGERKGPDLLPEARAVAERIGRGERTSCGCRSGPRAGRRSPRRPRSPAAPSRPGR